jgi:hypothetical protein
VSEIVVPGVPDLPDRPKATEPAHTCSGWVEIPRGTRPTCERCEQRLERYRHVAAGHGTVAEIREAISALNHVDGQPPLGTCVRTKIKGVVVWACPRSVNVGEQDDPTPLLDRQPNRDARRGWKKKRKRGQ